MKLDFSKLDEFIIDIFDSGLDENVIVRRYNNIKKELSAINKDHEVDKK